MALVENPEEVRNLIVSTLRRIVSRTARLLAGYQGGPFPIGTPAQHLRSFQARLIDGHERD